MREPSTSFWPNGGPRLLKRWRRKRLAGVVLDSPAVLAVLNREPGADEVWTHLPGAHLSAVTAANVAGKLVDGGASAPEAGWSLDRLGARIVAFEPRDVVPAANSRAGSRSAGLCLGARACLALARRPDLPALSAECMGRAEGRGGRPLDTGIRSPAGALPFLLAYAGVATSGSSSPLTAPGTLLPKNAVYSRILYRSRLA
jgi:PIN domain nuclease of toxin-antitoxin system